MINWLKFLIWVYSLEEDRFAKVTLQTGEKFYFCVFVNDDGMDETSFFYKGKSGKFEEIEKYVTDSVRFEMCYWRK